MRTMILKEYHPLPKFPPVSISGGECLLNCRHCSGTYLKGMVSATSPDELISVGSKLKQSSGVGMLISGGSSPDGKLLNLDRMLPSISFIKEKLNLIVNIHPGLLEEDTALRLNVDFASLDIQGDDIIKDVLGLKTSTEDYLKTYDILIQAGINVVPHVCIFSGGEDVLLNNIVPPPIIVVIVFTPTKKTPMENYSPPGASIIGDVISKLHDKFPNTEISLGCMRPRDRSIRTEIEITALEAGIARIELPSRRTVQYAKMKGLAIKRFNSCCALPQELEARVKT